MDMRLSVEIKGLVPMIQHNGQLANPFNRFVVAMKKITSKHHSKVTMDDRLELSRLEFLGGLYLDEKEHPCIPGEVIEGFCRKAAKKYSKGKESLAGVRSYGNWPLIYTGPKTADKLWANKSFVDVRNMALDKKKILRTRPIFPEWALRFEMQYEPEVIDLETVKDILAAGSVTHGLGDSTPRYGRFAVVRIEELGEVALPAIG